MKTIFRVFSYLKRYPKLGSLQLLCAVVGTLLAIVFPNVARLVLDVAVPQQRADLLFNYTVLACVAYFGRDLLNSVRIMLNNTFEQKIIFDIRSDLYQKLQRLPLRWFDNRPTGDIMTRVAEDVTAMERVLIDGIEQGVVALLQIIAVGFVMFWINPTLAWWAVVPVPLLFIGALIYTSTRDRYRTVRKATSEMNALLHDNISGIRQIKAYTMEKEEHQRFNAASDKVRKATLRTMFAWAIYNPTMSFVGGIGFILVMGFGGKLALEGDMTPGEITAFLLYLTLFYEPISRLHQLNQMLQSGRAAGERVFEILDADEEPGLELGRELPEPVKGNVVYRDVSFSYGDELSTIKGVDLVADPGQTIALVGPTGAGKTTLINLLTRFYEYNEGQILVDGVEVNSIKKKSLRNAIGYVTQESFLFNGTVRENLLIANRESTDEQIWESLKVANAADFVRRLPQGLDTQVGERGVKLSVGEKQRVSVARSLLKNPPILLLDEATASVDTETERLIQEALERLMQNRTSFVIAHRLSTVRGADRIYVLKDGELIESGNHKELLSQSGLYADLCRTSFLDETNESS
ncbi:MAG: ABC transporter ATP-binding protein [Verrucomicrobiales bacterium]|nr:ABC transporter ATP-binding protein [Verrucomicrobiales bacterium]HAA87974.1 ABC transporter ATP-binding protein [Verrucomicrobiales bacterium]|tara:strand:+ start:2644 stop:4380 length:1737 start_codon:yes stop_codon:yes gene_type:complete